MEDTMDTKNEMNDNETQTVGMNSEVPRPVVRPKRPYILLFVLLGFILVGLGAFYLGKRQVASQVETVVQLEETPSQVQAIPPAEDFKDSLGLTTISYLSSGGTIYLKSTIDLFDPILSYPNSTLRSITNVYTQQIDNTFEPVVVQNTSALTGKWVELIKEPIYPPNTLVSDIIFSLKIIPNTQRFLFVVEWYRADQTNATPPRLEQVLYYYDNGTNSEKLKKIEVFNKNTHQYAFPKIDSFSADGRYALIKLFSCWGCGGHTPETYLLDTQSLTTKNIGKVSYFNWQTNGNYEYKDYVVVECEEPTPGECSQDPATLPLKTGTL